MTGWVVICCERACSKVTALGKVNGQIKQATGCRARGYWLAGRVAGQ